MSTSTTSDVPSSNKSSTESEERREAFRRIRRSVIALAVGPEPGEPRKENDIYVIGTAFVVDRSGILVTAGHVIDPWIKHTEESRSRGVRPIVERIKLLISIPREHDPREIRFRTHLIPIDKTFRLDELDLAVLRLGPETDMPMPLEPVSFADGLCAEGDDVAVCGFPLGLELHSGIFEKQPIGVPSFSQGIVSALLPSSEVTSPLLHQYFQIHAITSRGNSGGPVFNPRTGDVVGILVSVTNNKPFVIVPLASPDLSDGAPADASGLEIAQLEIPTGLSRAIHAHHVIGAVRAEAEVRAAALRRP